MEEEFSFEEMKMAVTSDKFSSAPRPTGQTIVLYKCTLSVVPQILTSALNQLTFVPGLTESPNFAWFIPKPGGGGGGQHYQQSKASVLAWDHA
jgi:hypothetical protein